MRSATYEKITSQPLAETSRAALINHARRRLTIEIANDSRYESGLKNIIRTLDNKLESKNLSKKSKTRINFLTKRLPSFSKDFLDMELGSKDFEALFLPQLLEVFFRLAQQTASIYLAYAQQLIEIITRSAFNYDVVLFSGRDSFPLLLAYQEMCSRLKLSSVAQYAPFSRMSIMHLAGVIKNDAKAMAEIKAIEDFFVRRNLAGKHLLIADYGFAGSIERAMLSVLPLDKRPASLQHFLFSGLDFISTLGERYPHIARYGDIKGDRDYINNQIASFFRGNHSRADFIYWLQEIGSGINESNGGILVNSSSETNYKVAAIQQIVAYFAFLEGLKWFLSQQTPDETGLESLFQFYMQHSDFLKLFAAIEDNHIFPENERLQKILTQLARSLNLEEFRPFSVILLDSVVN